MTKQSDVGKCRRCANNAFRCIQADGSEAESLLLEYMAVDVVASVPHLLALGIVYSARSAYRNIHSRDSASKNGQRSYPIFHTNSHHPSVQIERHVVPPEIQLRKRNMTMGGTGRSAGFGGESSTFKIHLCSGAAQLFFRFSFPSSILFRFIGTFFSIFRSRIPLQGRSISTCDT